MRFNKKQNIATIPDMIRFTRANKINVYVLFYSYIKWEL